MAVTVWMTFEGATFLSAEKVVTVGNFVFTAVIIALANCRFRVGWGTVRRVASFALGWKHRPLLGPQLLGRRTHLSILLRRAIV